MLRIRPHQPPAPSIAPDHVVRLTGPGGGREVVIRSVAPHGRGHLLVAVAGVDDRTTAERLVGSTVLVRTADLPPPAPDEFYWHEVVGFRVETVDGRALGTIAETFSTGAHDVWVVRGEREHMIPVVDEVVRVLDRAGRRAVVDPPPGLLD
jgi:16S rRNA processing protein RimM